MRNEYPRPQFVRNQWINLNGEWDFEIDHTKTGEEKEYFKRESLNCKINVPFCPESKLSGIANTDFMECVWYRRNIEIPKDADGKRVILHFGAVDYHAILYVNGKKVGEHKGGYTSFSFDITDYLEKEKNYITLCAYDNLRSGNQPAGKQSDRYKSYGCMYTRTTGIWQTVWMEFVDEMHIENIKTTTEITAPSVTFEMEFTEASYDADISAEIFWDGKTVGSAKTSVSSKVITISADLSEKHLWKPGEGNLYDVKFTLSKNGEVKDTVDSYFGVRSVRLNGRAFQINGETVFGRWVLDQGFYPDGIYTAPSDEALKQDIVMSMQLGFNGARLHEKIFEPRFLYWADKLGYLVWEEHANWGFRTNRVGQFRYFLPEWKEAVKRDFNHPSIIGWAPFNETWNTDGKSEQDEILRTVYRATKDLDRTRPVIDTSGNYHAETDIFDVHDYQQDVAIFSTNYDEMTDGIVKDTIYCRPELRGLQEYDGKQPFFVSEYGGILWSDKKDGWGYGNNHPKTEEEFIERYKGMTESLLDNKNMLGFCYTQLYDVEQEQNGLITYERKFKFDPETIRKINTKKAAIEK